MDMPKKEAVPIGGPSRESMTPQRSTSSATYPRHLQLPFDLRDHKVKIEGEVLQTLVNIFLDVTGFAESNGRKYLHFTVKTLPQGPLPLTVGGVLIAVCDDSGNGRGILFPSLKPGNMSIKLCPEISGFQVPLSSASFRSFAASVTQAMFKLLPDLPVVEFILGNDKVFRVVLQDKVDIQSIRSQLPGRIAKCWTTYLNEKDLCRPSRMQAKRTTLPNPAENVVDDFAYTVIRPGVALFSPITEGQAPGFNTTSGALVEDSTGQRFMTAASHGIAEHGKMFQKLPLNGERHIGTVQGELPHTDIALVGLQTSVDFANEPVQDPEEQFPKFSTLFGQSQADEIDLESPVYLNSPSTGAMEGVVVHKSWRPYFGAASQPNPSQPTLVVYDWIYIGQNTDLEQRISDRACGAPVWDKEGRILGFFRYYINEGPFAGQYATVCADELVKAGFKLAV